MKTRALIFILACIISIPAFAQRDLGDRKQDEPIYFGYNTVDSDLEPVTKATDGTLAVYKDGVDSTETTTGITEDEDFDGKTGWHMVTIVTTDEFYAAGADYEVVLQGAVIDGITYTSTVLATFSIENRYMRGTDSAYTGTPPSAADIQAELEENGASILDTLNDNQGDWVTATGFATPTDVSDAVSSIASSITAAHKTTDAAIPSAATVADAVWDESQAGHRTAGTYGLYLDAQVSLAGTGSGDTAVTSATLNDLGADMTFKTAAGAGIGGATVRAYLTTEYAAGLFSVKGQTTTLDTGAWGPLYLDPGAQYTITFERAGYATATTTVTVGS